MAGIASIGSFTLERKTHFQFQNLEAKEVMMHKDLGEGV